MAGEQVVVTQRGPTEGREGVAAFLEKLSPDWAAVAATADDDS